MYIYNLGKWIQQIRPLTRQAELTIGKSELRAVKYFKAHDMRTKSRIAC